MLEARALSIGYGSRIVAAGIDLALARGEVLCLLGPNGAGKTTLFKTLLGLLPAKAGEVRLGGRAIEELSRTEMARTIAYVPQAQVMDFAYSVLDLVLMGRTAHLGPFAAPASRRSRAGAGGRGRYGAFSTSPRPMPIASPAASVSSRWWRGRWRRMRRSW